MDLDTDFENDQFFTSSPQKSGVIPHINNINNTHSTLNNIPSISPPAFQSTSSNTSITTNTAITNKSLKCSYNDGNPLLSLKGRMDQRIDDLFHPMEAYNIENRKTIERNPKTVSRLKSSRHHGHHIHHTNHRQYQNHNDTTNNSNNNSLVDSDESSNSIKISRNQIMNMLNNRQSKKEIKVLKQRGGIHTMQNFVFSQENKNRLIELQEQANENSVFDINKLLGEIDNAYDADYDDDYESFNEYHSANSSHHTINLGNSHKNTAINNNNNNEEFSPDSNSLRISSSTSSAASSSSPYYAPKSSRKSLNKNLLPSEMDVDPYSNTTISNNDNNTNNYEETQFISEENIEQRQLEEMLRLEQLELEELTANLSLV
ncbi:hypothetical protein BVG19_g4220 [[Candida] boidinii]|nr:hypothetical protein BVG19_g4220 [[Candida] boidinii]OWB54034.1 hypothetical protein B5S27_g5657 [[Candida] boidinii]